MRTCVAITFLLLLAGCRQTNPSAVKEEAKDEPVKQYAMHGEVLRLDADGKIAAIKAGKIGDWMEAMTMEYPVKDKAEFDKLRAGEKISATVYVQGNSYWVGGIQEDTAPAQSPAPASK
ncbi:MAG: copper-binding protein [Acidobacteriia bacterium]|nr:copper-binding protein [Terriglobia bacterium]